jgi:hypothetical protein
VHKCKRGPKCLGLDPNKPEEIVMTLSKEDFKKTKVFYCPACFDYLRSVMRIMHMATEDTNPEMTVDNF